MIMSLERNVFSDISKITTPKSEIESNLQLRNKWLKPRLLSCVFGVIFVISGIVVLLPLFSGKDDTEAPAHLKSEILKLFLPIMSIVSGVVLTFLGISLGETSTTKSNDEEDKDSVDSIYMIPVEKVTTHRMRTQKDENDELENDVQCDHGSSRRDSGIVIQVTQPSPPMPATPVKRNTLSQNQDNIMRLSISENEMNIGLSNIDDEGLGSGPISSSRRGSIESWSRVKIENRKN